MKIGIFGGTFNPPHIGHINACKEFIKSFDFDKVYVIPVFLPPHKQLSTTVSVEHRLAMSKIAFEELSPKVVISDIEIKRQGKSYTADTIRYFKERGDGDIYFLCGTDMILTMDTWYNPKYIFENATIVYIRRENSLENSLLLAKKIEEYKERFKAKIAVISTQVIDISSTDARNAIKSGEKLNNYLSEDIISYINKHKLYEEE